MPWNNCEINLILTWPSTCAIINSTGTRTFIITGTKIYALGVTLSTQYKAWQRQILKSGFNRTIIWNKYQSKISIEKQNQYLSKPIFTANHFRLFRRNCEVIVNLFCLNTVLIQNYSI